MIAALPLVSSSHVFVCLFLFFLCVCVFVFCVLFFVFAFVACFCFLVASFAVSRFMGKLGLAQIEFYSARVKLVLSQIEFCSA